MGLDVMAPPIKILTHQLRVLRALATGDALNRPKLCQAAGFSPTSGTITNALNGIRPGSSTGSPRLGLVQMGLVERLELDIDGAMEVAFVITAAGRQALADRGEELPPLRDKDLSTNNRYKE